MSLEEDESEPVPDSRGTSSGGAGPAPAPGEAFRCEDPVWKMSDHSGRLAFLPPGPPVNGPPKVNLHFGAPDAYVQALRQHAVKTIAPELICDRQNIWEGELVDGKVPEWMYLRGKTLENHTRFHNWCQVITDDLQCDGRAQLAFVRLFTKNPPEAPHGYMEACRVLAHIFKDKSKNADEVMVEPRPWSRYMQRACEEAIEALEHCQDVKDLKTTTSSWNDWNAYTPAPPARKRPADSCRHERTWASSSSSGTTGTAKCKRKLVHS